MTKKIEQTLHCSKCGSHMKGDVYQSVNVTLDPKYKDQILNQEFFKVTCGSCGTVHPMEYSCLYHDMEQRLMIYLLPGEPEEVQEHLGEFQRSAAELMQGAEGEYRLRIVQNTNELMEKIRIFDRSLDDRVVELVKIFYFANLQERDPEFQATAIYFDEGETPENGFSLIFLLPDGRAGTCEVSLDFYHTVKTDYEKKLARAEEGENGEGFQIVNLDYAASILQ